jgi:hypothetical protein
MLGRPSSKPVVIDRYSSRRRSRRLLPRWAWLMLFGAAIGVAGVLYVQQAHLPPRLSAAESQRLQTDFTTADAERTRLAGELAQTKRQLDEAVAARQRAAADLATAQREPNALRAHIAALLDALPPDPRGGAVEVRAARFAHHGADGKLGYDLVLARRESGAAALDAVLQFVVAGKTARGSATTVTPDAVPVAVGRYEITSGSVALPAGFDPATATIRVLDRPGGRLLGMRVVYVR